MEGARRTAAPNPKGRSPCLVEHSTLHFGIGGLVFSVVLLVLGLVLTNQANFASDYVENQLSQQQISFTPVEGLSGEQDDAQCLVVYAGELMTTGKQAECYANEYIAFHLAAGRRGSRIPGRHLRHARRAAARAAGQLQEATDAGQSTETIQADLDAVNALRDTMFRGETLRGLLLTTYGFSIFGERAELAALALLHRRRRAVPAVDRRSRPRPPRAEERPDALAPTEPEVEAPTPVTVAG